MKPNPSKSNMLCRYRMSQSSNLISSTKNNHKTMTGHSDKIFYIVYLKALSLLSMAAASNISAITYQSLDTGHLLSSSVSPAAVVLPVILWTAFLLPRGAER